MSMIKRIVSLQKIQNNKIWTQCSPPLNGKSIRNEIPAYRSEVRFIQNARKQKYLMDSNLMYTDFIKAHAGPNLGRLENVQLRKILLY